MDRRQLALIALGGIAGATLRWGLSEALAETAFPWATLAANLVGCLVLGLVLQLPAHRMGLRVALGTGFCGGLTTFATFAVEFAQLRQADDFGTGAAYVAASMVLGAAAFVAARHTPVPWSES